MHEDGEFDDAGGFDLALGVVGSGRGSVEGLPQERDACFVLSFEGTNGCHPKTSYMDKTAVCDLSHTAVGRWLP